MMQDVLIAVPRRRDYVSDDGFDVYGDGGAGSMDFDSPLNGDVIRLWPESMQRPGHLGEGHLLLGHLGAPPGDGHLQERFLCGPHLRPAADVIYQAGPYCFGRFQHAVVMRDALGNGDAENATTVTKTVNSAPRRAYCLHPLACDPDTDRATFSFVGSPDVG